MPTAHPAMLLATVLIAAPLAGCLGAEATLSVSTSVDEPVTLRVIVNASEAGDTRFDERIELPAYTGPSNGTDRERFSIPEEDTYHVTVLPDEGDAARGTFRSQGGGLVADLMGLGTDSLSVYVEETAEGLQVHLGLDHAD